MGRRADFQHPALATALAMTIVSTLGSCANGSSDAHPAITRSEPAPSVSVGACGTNPLPDCPLQAWMKSMATPAITTGDFAKLERVFTRIAELAPTGYPDWQRMTQDGQRSARDHSLEGCRVACRDCHDAMRARYRAEDRGRALPK